MSGESDAENENASSEEKVEIHQEDEMENKENTEVRTEVATDTAIMMKIAEDLTLIKVEMTRLRDELEELKYKSQEVANTSEVAIDVALETAAVVSEAVGETVDETKKDETTTEVVGETIPVTEAAPSLKKEDEKERKKFINIWSRK